MAQPVACRVNSKVDDWLEQKADEKATTKARLIEEWILEEYRAEAESEDNPARAPQLKEIDDSGKFVMETDDLDVAEQLRKEFGMWLADDDDGRLKDVRFSSETPGSVVRAINARWLEITGANEE